MTLARRQKTGRRRSCLFSCGVFSCGRERGGCPACCCRPPPSFLPQPPLRRHCCAPHHLSPASPSLPDTHTHTRSRSLLLPQNSRHTRSSRFPVYSDASHRLLLPSLLYHLPVIDHRKLGVATMKRSEINQAIRDAEQFIAANRFALPPFASWTPESWAAKGDECAEIRDNMLGWDITDFGRGNFRKCGLTLLTIRNGNQKRADKYPKPYAEKLLIVEEGQSCPYHFHWKKMEDLINRGGGVLQVTLYNSLPGSEAIDTKSDVRVHCDGVEKVFPAGHKLQLRPGESITMTQGLYHELSVVPGTGKVLIGEVSQCNDDNSDNRFAEKVGRFPKIIEDTKPYRLLCNEYPPAAKSAKL